MMPVFLCNFFLGKKSNNPPDINYIKAINRVNTLKEE
jgi:hypothetical protein